MAELDGFYARIEKEYLQTVPTRPVMAMPDYASSASNLKADENMGVRSMITHPHGGRG